jgi:hypothetical protein
MMRAVRVGRDPGPPAADERRHRGIQELPLEVPEGEVGGRHAGPHDPLATPARHRLIVHPPPEVLREQWILAEQDALQMSPEQHRHDVAAGAPRAHESHPGRSGIRVDLDDLDTRGIGPGVARCAVPLHRHVRDLHVFSVPG